MRFFTLLLIVTAQPLLAEAFDRPIPQSQSATAEVWFALASFALIAALVLVLVLVLVYRLVMRR